MSLVLLPCEVFHREFDAKLILASKLAAEQKMTVLLGYDKFFNALIPFLPKSILLDKSCSSIIYNGRIAPVKKNSGVVLINDEEGFNNLTSNFKYSWLNRVDKKAAATIDAYLAWGSVDKNFFSEVAELDGKIEIAGNCRSDLLNDLGRLYFKESIDSYATIFDNYVLISDNFCVERWKQDYTLPSFNVNPEQASIAQSEFAEHQRISKSKRDFMCNMLEPIIQERQDINFVIRPHPVANPLWWQQRFHRYRNVFVIYQDCIEPWLHSCRSLISMGCTTAIQALVARKNVIELTGVPTDSSSPHSFASKFINNTASSSEQLQALLDNPATVHTLSPLLHQAWSNIECSSSSIFAEIISRHRFKSNDTDILQLKNLLAQVNLDKMPTLDKEKWPYPSLNSLKRRLKSFHSSTLANKSLNFRQIIPGLYLLTPS